MIKTYSLSFLLSQYPFSRKIRLAALLAVVGLLLAVLLAAAESPKIYQLHLTGPTGSERFAYQVEVLPNGNIVVADPYYSTPSLPNVGAVYLFNGETLGLISMVTGSHPNDRVGLGAFWSEFAPSMTVLANGNFVVSSPEWNEGRGAVTWVNGESGLSGIVSDQNSLVGTTPTDYAWGSTVGDLFGSVVTALANGNYAAGSSTWNYTRGAVTFGNGDTGAIGNVSAENSLVGESGGDFIGDMGFVPLPNGNFLVLSPFWNNSRGAVTWVNGATGLIGTISSVNSLVGSSLYDYIGYNPWLQYYPDAGLVTILDSGNYVITSPYWNNGEVQDAGAVTWGSGVSGISGVVSSANSLVGSRSSDFVGQGKSVIPLTNGNYVVINMLWDQPSAADAGAVTWGSGTSGVKGVISSANSLVGSQAYDYVGRDGVTPLLNGNYVVNSSYWNNQKGAVTWGSGTSGVKGIVSGSNSLVGAALFDRVGSNGVLALTNGNYTASSPQWNNYRGAVSWGSGSSGISGLVSDLNSLVGSSSVDRVGYGVKALNNGNYVVTSPYWSGTNSYTGAITWGNGTSGTVGLVSASNSLTGSSPGDMAGAVEPFDFGINGVVALSNGHYVVASSLWNNNRGAVTWLNGNTSFSGTISAANSLVGSTPGDRLGTLFYDIPTNHLGLGITALTNGNYVVASPYWDNGADVDAGGVTWLSGTGPTAGVVTPGNSLVGSNTYDLVGSHGVMALPNGNYIVRSRFWTDMQAGRTETGAVTWGSGSFGVSGMVSAANSLVGSGDLDWVGTQPPIILSNSDYLVHTPTWDSPGGPDVGALSWGFGSSGTTGSISSHNSVLGTNSGQGYSMTFQPVNGNQRLVVRRDLDQVVTLVELLPRLSVILSGSGSGTVTSSPAGITCGSDCSELFNPGQQVTLTASPAIGSNFTGWTGACSGLGLCTLTMDESQQVTASFTSNLYSLSVTKSGDGAGIVTSSPAGIDCGSICTAQFNHGTLVSLSATPSPGSIFSGWSGACTGTGTCQVTMDSAKSVSAAFGLNTNTHLLTVTRQGTGTGTVTSSPSGIHCGIDCSEVFLHNTVVTLTAVPESNAYFTGWSGACTGTGTCQVTMDSARSVSASFTQMTEGGFTVVVNKFGNGFGLVTSTPGGINCGSDCSSMFLEYTEVVLEAQALPGSNFEGWSGACIGRGSCTLYISHDLEVWVNFTTEPAGFNLYLPMITSR
jgi:hypothetical protein